MITVKSYLSAINSYVRSHLLISGLIGVAVLGGAGYFLLGGKNGNIETLTVHHGEFLQQISVSGTVVAAQDVNLGFSEGGRVAHIYSQVGQRVFAGAVIAAVENGDRYAVVLQKRAALEASQADLARLEAGKRPEEIAVSVAQVEIDKAALSQANQAVLNALQNGYTKSDDAVRNKTDQFISNPRSSNPKLAFPVTDSQVENDLESKRMKVEDVLVTWAADIAVLSPGTAIGATDSAKTNLNQIISFLSTANAALNRAVTTQTITASIIASWLTDVSTARTNVNGAMDTLTSAVTAQKNAAATLQKDEKKVALDKAGSAESDIDAQQAKVKAAQADLQGAQAQFGKTLIVAPFSGVVTKVDVKEGEIAGAALSPVGLMSEGTMQIESFVPEVNIALITVGNVASVTLDAYGTNSVFTAKVISIEPARTVRDGVSTYKAKLQFDTADPRIRTGMTANILITTEKKSNVLSVPQGVVILKNGKKYVPVMENGEKVEREVTAGSVSSLGMVEVLSGLTDGDTVILSVAK